MTLLAVRAYPLVVILAVTVLWFAVEVTTTTSVSAFVGPFHQHQTNVACVGRQSQFYLVESVVEAPPSPVRDTAAMTVSGTNDSAIETSAPNKKHVQEEDEHSSKRTSVNKDKLIPYSLGLRSYRSETKTRSQKRLGEQLLNQVTFFSDSVTRPYTLNVQANKEIVAKKPSPPPYNSSSGYASGCHNEPGLLEPRTVRFSVDTEAVASSDAQTVLVPLDSTYQYGHNANLVNRRHGDPEMMLPVLPIPFAPQENRTTPISLAENLLLQIAPKVMNEMSSSIPPLKMMYWNASAVNDVWNSSMVSAAAVNAQQAMQNLSATASLAESLLQFMEQAVQQPSNEIMNLTARLGSQATQQVESTLANTAATTTTMINKNFNPSKVNRTRTTTPLVTRSVPFKKMESTLSTTPATTRRTLSPPKLPPPPPLPLKNMMGKARTDVLTLDDLDVILQANGYVRKTDIPMVLEEQQMSNMKSYGLDGLGEPVSAQQHALKSSAKAKSASSSSSGGSKTVAFPQPSVLSYESLKWGTTVSSGFLAMMFFMAIPSNLWLVGVIAGSFYGYDLGKQLPVRMPKTILPGVLVRVGSRTARTSLQVYDFVNALIFMWKTGVLSYEYWKQYATLDKRFKIQDKIDAWNARFIEGKEQFDKWEKDNEVGRKVLATLRTVWLVEERSLKKGLMKSRRERRSRYRIIQLVYDLAYIVGKFIGSVVRLLTGGDNTELTEFWRGIRANRSLAGLGVGGLGARVGAVVGALIMVNLMGALFTISPIFLGICATIAGLIWPTWLTELVDRWTQYLQDTRTVGQGEMTATRTRNASTSSSSSSPFSALRRSPVDRTQYNFFVRKNGTKRYYRTGQPIWPWLKPRPKNKRRWWTKQEEDDQFGFLK